MKKIKAVILSFVMLLCGCSDLEGPNSGGVVFNDSGSGLGDENRSAAVSAGLYTAEKGCFTENDLRSLFGGEPERTEEDQLVRLKLGAAQGYINSAGSLGYYTDDGDRFDSAQSYLENEGDYGAYMDESSDLEFASRDEARAGILAVFEKLGFSAENVEIEKQYSVKKSGYDYYKEARRKEAENADDSDRDKAQKRADKAAQTESRDFYYFETTLKQDGIPFYSGKAFEYSNRIDDFILGTRGSIVYTEKGVEYMALLCHYKPNGAAESAELIGFSEAKRLAAEKFSDAFFDSGIEIYDSELVYLAFYENNASEMRKTAQLRPSYVFHCRMKNTNNGETYTSEFSVFFDAVSGKEIGTSW